MENVTTVQAQVSTIFHHHYNIETFPQFGPDTRAYISDFASKNSSNMKLICRYRLCHRVLVILSLFAAVEIVTAI